MSVLALILAAGDIELAVSSQLLVLLWCEPDRRSILSAAPRGWGRQRVRHSSRGADTTIMLMMAGRKKKKKFSCVIRQPAAV